MKNLGTMTAFCMLAIWCIQVCIASGTRAQSEADTNPLQKVLQMLSKMQQDVIKSGKEQHAAYTKFGRMCDVRSHELQHEIKAATAQVEDHRATINKATDDDSEAGTQIEELSSAISTTESDLKAASSIRDKEAGEFAENQKDLLETISQMERAISVIEKQLKNVASFSQIPLELTPRSEQAALGGVQKHHAEALAQALSAIVDASFISSADASSLSAFIQSSEQDTEADTELDAAAESYSSSQGLKGDAGSASILETLQGLLEKAQATLQGARTKEATSSHNFLMFKASLERKLAVDTKEMNDVKKEKAEAGQTRAEAEGDLEVVKKDLKEDKIALGELHHECMTRANDFEDDAKSRNDEVKAIVMAKKVLQEMTGAAEKATYSALVQVSFLQTRSRSSASMPPSMEVARRVLQLGREQHASALVQMAKKMESVVRNSMVSGIDPFQKVKSMLASMLEHLTKQMEDEATHKAYCDKEMSDTKKHKDVKKALEDKLQTKIDTQTSHSMNLKRQVADLQRNLLAIQQTQKEMGAMRSEEHALYQKTKPELELGLDGVKKALKVLREYYSQEEDKEHDAASGAGAGVISMLEIVESDFAKGIAALEDQEETARTDYEAQTRENNKAKAIKEQDVIFKTKEAKSLEKSTAESSTDLDGVQTELDAIREYFNKIQEECVAKPDTYQERRKRQQQTLQGLQDAAQILEGRAALVQSMARLRGTHLA
jgi:hypothetical protein